ncbi:MAG: hypothetical protein KJP07_23310 [Desulfatitalea sp.]|nr:hypothetical protein [Desulfatitalea sp.]
MSGEIFKIIKSIQNIIMRLKNKGFIRIEDRGKSRKIHLITEKIFGNSQLPKQVNGNSQLPVGNSQLPPYKKEKEKKNIKEKSAKKPSADFLQKQKSWQSIPIEIRRRLNKNQVVKASIEKIEYAIERMNAANGSYLKRYPLNMRMATGS